MTIRIRSLFLICLGIFLSACEMKSPTIASTSTLEFTATMSPTKTTTQTPAVTKKPTATASTTPYQTLNPEEEKAEILGLLQTNGNCKLPCWWGITPGTTTQSEAEEILRNYRLPFQEFNPIILGPLSLPGLELDFWLNYPDGDLEISVKYRFQDDILKYIKINSYFYATQATVSMPNFREALSAYAPEKIIPMFGVPTRIMIISSYGPGEGASEYAVHDLFIFYDHQGIRLNYLVGNDLSTKNRICPTFSNYGNLSGHIEILLASPYEDSPIETYDQSSSYHQAKTIEKAAGITPEEFYALFTQTSNPICFNTLPSVWP